jgi:hypothetical protein
VNKKISSCRLCDSNSLVKIIDLKDQPPANSLHKKKEKIKKFPLIVLFCKKCSTSQLSVSLDPKYLFKKYFWVTATSSTAKKHSLFFFKKMSQYLKKSSNIVEVASNDGTFLDPFKKNGHTVLGIDPASNIAKMANSKGIKTIAKFFNYELSKSIKKKFKDNKIIFARNVIPHVTNIHSVVKGISNLANKKSIVAIEFHYSKDILLDLQYDSIYHEHIFYFTIKTISTLFKKHNLHPFDVFKSPISGGSLVLLFSKEKIEKSNLLKKMEFDEKKLKINSLKKWEIFGKKSLLHANKFKNEVIKNLSNNNKIFGYGASARSSTLLNFCDLNDSKIDFIIDQNSLKQNLYTPGTNIPIYSFQKVEKKIKNMKMVLLAWNFKNEIVKYMKSKKFKNKIIIPLKNNDF